MSYRDATIDLTEIGLGEGLAAFARDRLRYIAADDVWCVWTGKRWRQDDVLARQEIAKAYAETLDAAVDTIEDDRARRAAHSSVNRARSVAGLRAVLTSASSTTTIASRRELWDADPYLLHTASGVVDLRDGSIRPATPADLMLRSTRCAVGEGEPARWV